MPADYDGDGKSERAFFHPGSGEWTICDEIDVNSSICDPSTYLFGQQGDIPAEKCPAYPTYPYWLSGIETLHLEKLNTIPTFL